MLATWGIGGPDGASAAMIGNRMCHEIVNGSQILEAGKMTPGVGHRRKLFVRKVRGFVTSFGLWSTWSDLRTGARRDLCHHVAPSPKLCLTRLIFTPIGFKLNLESLLHMNFCCCCCCWCCCCCCCFFFLFLISVFAISLKISFSVFGIGFGFGFERCFFLLSFKFLF